MNLVIVGSVGKTWSADDRLLVLDLIDTILVKYRDREGDALTVGSGRSPNGGVDIWVEERCRALGIRFQAFPPVHCRTEARCTNRFEHMYRPRDLAMAEWCTHLIRICSVWSTTYGSGWTRDQAKRLGKPVAEFTPNAPREVEGNAGQ